MITVPDGFGAILGDQAREWRAALPALATKCCARWRLTPDGDLLHGNVAVVLPVRRADGHPAVLKLTWLDDETRQEPAALRAWDGQGVVALLDHDDRDGALLLERLDHTRSLLDAPIEEALAVTGGLLRRLRVPAGPGLRRHEFPDLVAENAALGGPLPAALVEQARELGRDLAGTAGNTLVNQDLHYENVLRGDREPWLMIDPKPLAGDREFGMIPLLWNRFGELAGDRGLRDRFAALCDIGELDGGRARAWTFCRAVDTWLWCLEGGWDGMAVAVEAISRAFRP
ncbi:aminoglycoside/hydroxyurea antibiotic resistance kinase [Saccharothrix sp. 6-C]|uniref:aminoglycoside phosphotransferase family protein n=1 Tax=Saccharothrix sp. 6-C TaxID=2781735 RepID=UPI0019178156|nr:aminoglycoside phosphotransferase family protein [Saccharothrix sp. 6-C]QQQ77241.1 aminoglycoside/hydroxyurea antibiotic resistance kinase [Saccharothrix sp. 6-C]